LRYTRALAANFHRYLVEGGPYFYQSDPGNWDDGKERWLFECSPLGFIGGFEEVALHNDVFSSGRHEQPV